MIATFRYTFRRFRGGILGWGIAVFFIGFITPGLYTFVEQQEEQLRELITSLPDAFSGFVGDVDHVMSPAGFLHARIFQLMPIILGIYASLLGSGLLASDEESGRLDLIMAYPVSRGRLIAGRLLAMLAALLFILLLLWSGLGLGMVSTGMKLSPWQLAPAFLNLFSVILLTAGLALMLSMLMPARRYAGTTAGMVIVVSFFVTGFAGTLEAFVPLAKMLPLWYYVGGHAIDKPSSSSTLGLSGAAALFTAIAAWRFRARDIRVAGEGVLRWQPLAAVSASLVTVIGIATYYGLQPPRYGSPQDVFTAASRALQKHDGAALAECLTEESLEEWNAAFVLYGAMVELQSGPDSSLMSMWSGKIDEQQLKTALSTVTKLKLAMAHVDKDRLKDFEPLVRSAMAGIVLTGGEVTINDEQRKLAGLVNEPKVFFAKAFDAWTVTRSYRQNWRLEDVEASGDTATARLLGEDGGSRKIAFHRIAGSWRIELPFLPGEAAANSGNDKSFRPPRE